MRANYFLFIDLVSNQKFSGEELNNFRNLLESNDDLVLFCDLINKGTTLSFSNHLEVYLEDHPFESDLTSDIESLVKSLDFLIPGGWANDSKIEWISDSPSCSNVWFKDDNVWKNVVKQIDRSVLSDETTWDDFENDDDFFGEYDDF